MAFTDAAQARIFDTDNLTRFVIGRFAPGADHAAVVRRLSAISYGPEVFGIPNPPPDARLVVPPEVNHLRQIDWFLPTLAALLAVLALLAIGHALVTAVRRRRREFALLKTLGFDRRQVRTTVAWQATTLTAIGLVVGVPLGLLAGSYAWGLVANGLGVSTIVTVPVLAVALCDSGRDRARQSHRLVPRAPGRRAPDRLSPSRASEQNEPVRLGLISDIHGNRVALDAVIADGRAQRRRVVVGARRPRGDRARAGRRRTTRLRALARRAVRTRQH